MTSFLQQILNGIYLGSMYALIALGYTMVYGVLRLINFAHGDVYMFGAFMGYYLARLNAPATPAASSLPRAIFITILSMILSALLGIIIERFAYRPGRGRAPFTLAFWLGILGAVIGHFIVPTIGAMIGGAVVGIVAGLLLEKFVFKTIRKASRLALLILAIGVSFLLENGGQLVFGPDPKFFPQIIPSTQFNLGQLSINNQQVTVFVVAIILMVLLTVFVNYTRTGKAMRAVSFNIDAAKLMGINTDRIIAITFAVGSALAGAGGILVSLNYPKIEPLMGILPGLKAFVAAVLGGIGNIPGAMIGAFVIGIAEVMTVGYLQSTYRDAIAFSILILILLLKPTGLLGKGLVEKV
jgi:branched-chain amino acid transport system permease protein